MKTLEQFKNDISEEEKSKIIAYVEEQKAAGKTSAKDLTEYIRNMGYDVTADDIKEAMERDDKAMAQLDDEELDGVAGGQGSTGEENASGLRRYCDTCKKMVMARPTGKDDGAFFLWAKYEYVCPVCHETFWS